MEENSLYQYSLLNALMEGVCNSGITVRDYVRKGTHGFGTFVRMDGEMIFLDGKVYQLRAHGDVAEAGPDVQLPFAIALTFRPEATETVRLGGKDDIERALDAFNDHAKNLYLAYRITGVFARIRYRTVQGQEYEGQPLAQLADKQFVDACRDVDATIVGLRTPQYWQGFGVAGEHLHFIDKDRKLGGHVLDLQGSDLRMEMAVVKHINMELPTTSDFNKADLRIDDAGIKKAEG